MHASQTRPVVLEPGLQARSTMRATENALKEDDWENITDVDFSENQSSSNGLKVLHPSIVPQAG